MVVGRGCCVVGLDLGLAGRGLRARGYAFEEDATEWRWWAHGGEVAEAPTRKQEVASPVAVLRRPGSMEAEVAAPDRRQQCGMFAAAMGAATCMAGGQAWRAALLLVAMLVTPLTLRLDRPPEPKPCTDFVSAKDGGPFGVVPLFCVVVVVPS